MSKILDRMRRRHKREKATLDTVADKVGEPKGRVHNPTTPSGDPIEEQVRKTWDPKKDGGLPNFLTRPVQLARPARRSRR